MMFATLLATLVLYLTNISLFHIRSLLCLILLLLAIRPHLDSETASTITTSIVHSKTWLPYCNSLYYNLPKSQIIHLQHIQNSLAQSSQILSHHSDSSLSSLIQGNRVNWIQTPLTYKVLTTTKPSYLHHLITVQPLHSTNSSFLVTLTRPPTSSSLLITDCSFRYASP